MASKILKLFLLLLIPAMFLVLSTAAQDFEQCSYVDNFPRKEPLPDNIRERLITLCIEEDKKDFKELLKRTEDVARLSKEIEESYAENNKLSADDRDKLKEAEDLLGKIRRELNADDDDDEDADDEKLSDTLQAIRSLQENADKLLDEIKKTTRYTISAAAIQSSNVVKKIIKFLRFNN